MGLSEDGGSETAYDDAANGIGTPVTPPKVNANVHRLKIRPAAGNRCNIATAGKCVFKTPKGKDGFCKDKSIPSVNKHSDLLWDAYGTNVFPQTIEVTY